MLHMHSPLSHVRSRSHCLHASCCLEPQDFRVNTSANNKAHGKPYNIRSACADATWPKVGSANPANEVCGCAGATEYLGLGFTPDLLMNSHRLGINSLLQSQAPTQTSCAVSTSARYHRGCLCARDRKYAMLHLSFCRMSIPFHMCLMS